MNKELSMRVMLVTQDKALQLEAQSALQQSGFEVSVAESTSQALEICIRMHPEFLIIDREIPNIGGLQLCKSINGKPELAETRSILLGISSDPTERILSLEVGADDYLARPFTMEDLLAKVSALQRRHPTARSNQVLKAGTIEMVPESWQVYVGGKQINLTEKEYRLLHELLQVKGRVLTRESLLERVWGHQKSFHLETRTVDVHMSRLRTKLGTSADNIITVRNIGYRINISPEWLGH